MTAAQLTLLNMIMKGILEYTLLYHEIKGMTDEECHKNLDALREVRALQRKRLDLH